MRDDSQKMRPQLKPASKRMRRLAEDRIKNDLEAEEGTAAVKVSGGLEDEIQIQVDQQKLSQLGHQHSSKLRRESAPRT